MMKNEVVVIGAGLAGSECAFQLANFGIKVILYEMKSIKKSPAHISNNFAELVCSNSFRSDNINSAVGLMHQELRILNSLIIKQADKNKVPAGEALAVDRENFSKSITEIIENHPNIVIKKEEFYNLQEISKDSIVVIATGPLTSNKLNEEIECIIDKNYLNFFDAIAPIIYKDSIDFNKAWYQSRYDKGESADYINCALNEEEYNIFYEELIKGQYQEFKEWEKDIKYFEGCLPIEEMARRGKKTLLFGPLKPVGLQDTRTSEKPFAVIQLRQDNLQGTLYNMVGFQTKLIYNEQKRIFRLIPALKEAKFAKLGSIHKNTFINSPKLLNNNLSLKSNSNIFFAGQITGCEGYVESTAVGLLCALFVRAKINKDNIEIPKVSALGAILNHITDDFSKNFQPSNINYGLFPKLDLPKKVKSLEKKSFISSTSLENIHNFSVII